jgi:multidrug efflux pump
VKISELSISRPVMATVVSLVILLFGAISYTRLPVREYPDIDPPIVSVTTLYRGASPSVVETEITNVLEEQLSTVEGVKTLTSNSREQGSVISIEFELGRDVNEAANDVRDRVSRIRGSLPREAEDPVVEKVDVNAQPIIWLALYSKTLSNLEVTDYADRTLKERIQRLPGVASVFLGGERRYAMRVWLDPSKMSNFGLTTIDVENAIRLANAEIPAGRIEGIGREFAVRTRGELTTPQAFEAIIIKEDDTRKVRLGDIATIELGAQDERTVTRYNGESALGLGIVKQQQASTLDVGDAIIDALPEFRKSLPAGMELAVAYNSAEFIQQSLDEVVETLIIATILVILVILVFLKDIRATLIPTLAIPVSIIGSFTAIYALGYSINILTLLALVLSIGLVVDDAIVMLENIYRHMQMGKTRLRAAYDGAKEIGFAILATTIALVAVFVPLAYLEGNVGRLFNEFGVAVAVSVLISGLVALTFTPMICSKILTNTAGKSTWAQRSFDGFFRWLDSSYGGTLKFSLQARGLVIFSALLLLIGTAWIFTLIPSELVPTEDRGTAFGVAIAPEGSTLEYTDRYVRQIEQMLLAVPEREGLFTAIGLGFQGPGRVTDAIIFMRLKDRSQRERSQQEIVESLFGPIFGGVSGVMAFLINPPSLGQDFADPVQFVLQAATYEQLSQSVGSIMGQAMQLGYFSRVDTDLKLNKPQLDVTIDRERAAQLGVSVTDIGSALETFLGGRVVSDYKQTGEQYDVIVQLRSADRATPRTVEEIYIRGKNGLVQLANVVTVSESVAPKELNHFNRVRSATITATINPASGKTLGDALTDLDKIAASSLPAGVSTDYSGQSREFRESSSALYWLFAVALVFIYLVLAAQFESFVHPITILLSVPLALVGAIISLKFTGQTMNIYSQIGLIMLIGLVTKNSILIVEYANQLREEGKELFEAVSTAARLRLRPILMTSFATIFGILPIAVGLGAGGEARAPLGIAVVGGMFFSTFFTLIVVPVVYTFLKGKTKHATEKPHTDESLPDVSI